MLLSSQNKSSPPLSCPAEVSIANAANSAIPQPRSSQPCLRLGDGSGAAAAAGIPRDAPPGFPGGAVRPRRQSGRLSVCPFVRLSVRPSVRPCPRLRGCPAAAPRFGVGSSSPPALPGKTRREQDKHNLVCEREGLSSCLFFFSSSSFFFFSLLLPFSIFFPLFSPPRHEKPPVPEVPQTMEPVCWYRRS